MRYHMKILLFFVLIFVSFSIMIAKKHDIVVNLENISDTCQYGRTIIFQDSDNDESFDRTRITNCDFSYKLYDLMVIGIGELLSGLTANIVNGDIDSNTFNIRIYDPYNKITVAYFYYDKQYNKVVLDYSFNNVIYPYYNEIQNIITSINGYITFEIDSMNVFNDDIELILFDINGRKIEYFPMIEFTSDHLMIDISNLNFGFYFIGLKSAFYWHYYKLFIDN